jgi:hypothetical protein
MTSGTRDIWTEVDDALAVSACIDRLVEDARRRLMERAPGGR